MSIAVLGSKVTVTQPTPGPRVRLVSAVSPIGLLVANNNLSDVPDKAAARTALQITAGNPKTANAVDLGVVTGTVSDAVALANAQKINAFLAAAEGNAFDWRSDVIGIGETIRLGQHGNAVFGRPGARVFGAATSGARALWQGASGVVMFDNRHLTTTSDVYSTLVYGVSANGNALAGVGFRWAGTEKAAGYYLHVANLRDNAASYAYSWGSNPSATGGQVDCSYGGSFDQLTSAVSGSANGFLLTGKTGASGTNTTFTTFGYLHCTCLNGFSFVFDKMDDVVIKQIGVSRAAGGTGAAVLFNSNRANSKFVVGNKIHNMNLSKMDGPAIQIIVADDATFGNEITYNGVDYTPSLVLGGGSLLEHNKWRFLGRTNYLGGWGDQPSENLFPLPNANSTNPIILDWYQESDPSVLILINGTSSGITQTVNSSRLVRIGRLVTLNFDITVSSRGSFAATDAVIIWLGGLPAALQPSGGAVTGSVIALGGTGITASFGAFGGGTTNVTLYRGTAAGGALQYQHIADGFRIAGQLNWQTPIT